jgi:hypothetical protein
MLCSSAAIAAASSSRSTSSAWTCGMCACASGLHMQGYGFAYARTCIGQIILGSWSERRVGQTTHTALVHVQQKRKLGHLGIQGFCPLVRDLHQAIGIIQQLAQLLD